MFEYFLNLVQDEQDDDWTFGKILFPNKTD
jgi:hypothetical protein